MTRCPGVPLSEVFKDLSEKDKQAVISQLKGYIKELRELVPPEDGYVGTMNGTPFDDEQVFSKPTGPISSVEKFHLAIRDGVVRAGYS